MATSASNTAVAELAPAQVAASDDATLIDAARSGDRAAFARLYERYAPLVHGVLLSRLRPADADDLTQEVFIQVLRTIDRLRDPAAFGPWLCVAARNRATSFRRRLWRRPFLSLTSEPASRAECAGLTAQEVLDAIRSLPEPYHETLILRLVERMPGPQIAARTGLSHGSVRVNLTRGMHLLRERLGPALEGKS